VVFNTVLLGNNWPNIILETRNDVYTYVRLCVHLMKHMRSSFTINHARTSMCVCVCVCVCLCKNVCMCVYACVYRLIFHRSLFLGLVDINTGIEMVLMNGVILLQDSL
jgi:hypothetical protein